MGKFLLWFQERLKRWHTNVNRNVLWADEIPVSISQKADDDQVASTVARLELPTSTAKRLRPVTVIATLFATPNRSKQKTPPRFRGRHFRISALRHDCGIFTVFSSKTACSLWSWQDSNLWPRRCERRVLTNWTTRPCVSSVHCVQYVHSVWF